MIRITFITLLLLLVLRTDYTFPQNETADLKSLMDSVFPGNTLTLIDGAYNTPQHNVCMNEDLFGTASSYLIPQGLLDHADYTPYRDVFFMHTIVAKGDKSDKFYPSKVVVTVIEPDIHSQNAWPIIPGALELFTDSPFPRAEAYISIEQGDISNTENFLNATGKILFEYQQIDLAEERRLAFEFEAENADSQNLHISGALYNVSISEYLSYDDLPVGESTFAALSGLVYSVKYANTVDAKFEIVNDRVHYAIRIETTALINEESNTSPVSVAMSFTAGERKDNDFGGFDVLNAEVEVENNLLSDYQIVPLYHFVELIPDGDTLSGKAKLSFSNGCGGYIQIDLLFRDIPLKAA